ncbi:MAG: TonB-dependent receptor [Bacteroidales bacterium]|nr:TonB-dependent receptor [Bacteroidales bacterium]
MKRVFLLLASLLLFAQLHAQFSINGTVLGPGQEKLTGANIILKNSFRGTVSGHDGSFKLSNLKQGSYILVVSFLGYETVEIPVKLGKDEYLEITLVESLLIGDEIIIKGTRAESKTPSTYSTIDKDEIERTNFGQDLPVLLNGMTSVIATTDAGNGVGYTGMRIRGTDINRINVTINGIPYNDAESHGAFWVDLPDFASSVENIQIQRGVGTSSNGAAAFGASVNLQTSNISVDPYMQADLGYGSFNTLKTNISFGTGLLKNKFTFDGRLSKISSDGFIDRAWSDLKSFYASAGYYTGKTVVRLYVFSGLEETYQAWNGVPKARLNSDSAGMADNIFGNGLNDEQAQNLLNSDSRTYNLYTYSNQIDHYLQSHYQLHFSHQLSKNLLFNTALHYTKGSGYYEDYKYDKKFSDYGLNNAIIGNDTITRTDLIQRKWLDNDFYGLVSNIIFSKDRFNLTLGGGANRYIGDHFGHIIWAEYNSGFDKDYEWYNGTGDKYDFNVYGKINVALSSKLNLYGDIQYRGIRYDISGIDDDGRDINMKGLDFDFLNPKFGIHYQINDFQNFYSSFAVAHREPNRSNYIDAPGGNLPTREILYDYEAGYNLKLDNLKLSISLYNMSYTDQLVLTGEINDVGNAIMVNVPESYRRGIEASGELKITKKIYWNGNITLSRNKIKNFTEYVDNWSYWDDPENQPYQYSKFLGTTDLSFSPGMIAASTINIMPVNNFGLSIISKYAGRQYIDNTSSLERSIDPYFVNHVYLHYGLNNRHIGEVTLKFMINNILNVEYETNAWVYRYYYNERHYALDGYFPQAGINYMAGLSWRF